MFILIALAYLVLLWLILKVYRPQKVEYPVSPLNVSDLGPPVSQYVDKGAYGGKCWDEVLDRYVGPEDLDFLHKVLRGYIDAIIEASLLNQRMEKHLHHAFTLLPLLAILSLSMWFLA